MEERFSKRSLTRMAQILLCICFLFLHVASACAEGAEEASKSINYNCDTNSNSFLLTPILGIDNGLCVIIGEQIFRITQFTKESDPQALVTFNALKFGIFTGNNGIFDNYGIYLTGRFEVIKSKPEQKKPNPNNPYTEIWMEKECVCTLTGWYIKAPFIDILDYDQEGEVGIKVRKELTHEMFSLKNLTDEEKLLIKTSKIHFDPHMQIYWIGEKPPILSRIKRSMARKSDGS